MATVAVLINDITSISTYIAGQRDMALGIDIAGLQASSAAAMVAKIKQLAKLDAGDAALMMRVLPTSAYTPEGRSAVATALNERLLAGVTAAPITTSGYQTMTRIDTFGTKRLWDVIDDRNVSLDTKMNTMAAEVVKMGISRASDDTIRFCVAALVLAHFERYPTYKTIYDIVCTFRECLKSLPCTNSFIKLYPESPSDLPADLFRQVYPDAADPPVFRNIPKLVLTARRHTPVRSSDKRVNPTPAAAPHAGLQQLLALLGGDGDAPAAGLQQRLLALQDDQRAATSPDFTVLRPGRGRRSAGTGPLALLDRGRVEPEPSPSPPRRAGSSADMNADAPFGTHAEVTAAAVAAHAVAVAAAAAAADAQAAVNAAAVHAATVAANATAAAAPAMVDDGMGMPAPRYASIADVDKHEALMFAAAEKRAADKKREKDDKAAADKALAAALRLEGARAALGLEGIGAPAHAVPPASASTESAAQRRRLRGKGNHPTGVKPDPVKTMKAEEGTAPPPAPNKRKHRSLVKYEAEAVTKTAAVVPGVGCPKCRYSTSGCAVCLRALLLAKK